MVAVELHPVGVLLSDSLPAYRSAHGRRLGRVPGRPFRLWRTRRTGFRPACCETLLALAADCRVINAAAALVC